MRYIVPLMIALYVGALVFLHALGLFPRAGRGDIARLIGTPTVVLEGEVADFPVTRWNQTRFVLKGRSVAPPGYTGNVSVTFGFPAEDLAPGDHLTVRGWLSAPRPSSSRHAFDETGYWGSQGVYALCKVWSPAGVLRYAPISRWRPLAWSWIVRQRFCAFCQRAFPAEEAGLLLGLTIGGRGILTPEFKALCIRAGVYHIVVVSGQNVAVLIASGLWIFQLARWPRHRIWIAAIPPILFYTQLTGADPPVLRAAIMSVYALVSAALRRDPPRLYGLAVGAGVLLLFWPEALFGASFQLTFAATAALLIGLPYLGGWGRTKNRIGRWFLDAVKACIVVHLGVWPVLIFYFHQLSLAGVLAPFTIYPLATLGMFCGLVLGALGTLNPAWVPDFAIQAVGGLMHFIIRCIQYLAHWSWAALPALPLREGRMVLYYLGLFGILFSLYWRQRYAQKTSPIFVRRARL